MSLYLDATLHVGGIEEKEEEEVFLLMSDANTKAPSKAYSCLFYNTAGS